MANDKKPDSGPTSETKPEGGSEAEVGKQLYTLTKKWFDGANIHAVGDQMYFADGEGPRDKVLTAEQEVRPDFSNRPQTTAGNEVRKKN